MSPAKARKRAQQSATQRSHHPTGIWEETQRPEEGQGGGAATKLGIAAKRRKSRRKEWQENTDDDYCARTKNLRQNERFGRIAVQRNAEDRKIWWAKSLA